MSPSSWSLGQARGLARHRQADAEAQRHVVEDAAVEEGVGARHLRLDRAQRIPLVADRAVIDPLRTEGERKRARRLDQAQDRVDRQLAARRRGQVQVLPDRGIVAGARALREHQPLRRRLRVHRHDEPLRRDLKPGPEPAESFSTRLPSRLRVTVMPIGSLQPGAKRPAVAVAPASFFLMSVNALRASRPSSGAYTPPGPGTARRGRSGPRRARTGCCWGSPARRRPRSGTTRPR